MSDQARQRHDRWHLAAVLHQYATLRIMPSGGDDLLLSGSVPFHVIGPDRKPLQDEYEIEVTVPPNFPRELALAKETGGRIPKSYHKLEGDYLCLATHTEQRLVLAAEPTLPGFLKRLVRVRSVKRIFLPSG